MRNDEINDLILLWSKVYDMDLTVGREYVLLTLYLAIDPNFLVRGNNIIQNAIVSSHFRKATS